MSMSTNNVKLLNEINHSFTSQLEKYSDNYQVLEKINTYITTELKLHLNKIHRDVDNLEKVEKEKNYFINKFLSSMENIFYYVKKKDVFVHYDMKHYKIYEEDKLISDIYKEITEHYPLLHSLKFNILQDIVNELKDQTLFNCLPESCTIQNIIKYLMTYFFESKDDAKYFCCVVGDIILNKTMNVEICINKQLVEFIEAFELVIQKGLGQMLTVELSDQFLSNTIFSSTDLKNHRIIKSNTGDQRCLWNGFLKQHAIDLMVVCIHYSKRYLNSENYIKHHKSPTTILYLKTNSINEIIEEFCLNKLDVKKDSTIHYENIEYLWHMFLHDKYIPDTILSKTELHDTIKSHIQYDHLNKKYLSIFHKDVQLIEDARHFFNNELVVDVSDELEVSELIAIFEEHHYPVDESAMVNLVKYFTYCELTDDNKVICDTRCKLWDKKGELNTFISIMKQGATSNYPITTNLSFNTIYTKYCKYTSNNGNVSKIVTKKYFVDYIINTIPSDFIVFNKVTKDFWY